MTKTFLALFQRLITWLKVKMAATPSRQHLGEEELNPNQTVVFNYSKHLIPALKDDHQNLLVIYTEIMALSDKQQYQAIQDKLNEFKDLLIRHLMTENVKFYGYLEHSLNEDETQFNTMREYRKEMNTIAHTVKQFLRKWTDTLIAEKNIEVFKSEFTAIGEVLAKRIKREEEHLYTMYEPILRANVA